MAPESEAVRWEALCRERGLPLTVQRRAVLETLLARRDHPTAEQIHAAVAERLRGISRATVYRILEVLVRAGVVRKVWHAAAGARFEIAARRHHHLVCVACDTVKDFEDPGLEDLEPSLGRRFGFRLMDYSIQFLGLCRDCAARPRSSRRVKHAR